ncbi:MAG: SulP family inorganic anion transporter, partial [Chlamydiales bacterium]|nr:SulP family inorganic anion transporter [Chlamydiales bacterium]
HITKVPIDFIPKWMALFHGFSTWDPLTFAVALSTLLLIILIRRYFPVIPWGIGSIVVITATTWGFDLPVETIASRFGEIPSLLPTFSLPHFSSSFLKWHTFIPDAITIAFLAGIESLLSAVVADGMTGRRHKSNCELMAQGIANIISVLFGGIPATGAVARTAVSIKSGAKTPVAGMIHAVVLLVIILTCASTVSQISLASLSAVLMVIAWNMAEIKHFRRIFKSPPGDILVLLVTFLITVLVDLTTAVGVGMILAAFLFMKRVSDFSAVSPILILEQEKNALQKPDPDRIEKKEIATGVEVYEIEGPFFFGVTERLKDLVAILKSPPRVFILRMRKVPMIDASGMHALEDFYYKCHRDKTVLLLSEVNSAVLYSLKKFGLLRLLSEQHIFSHIDPALAYAEKCAKAS